MDELTKRCPLCDEEIRANAVKCKHCGSFIGDGPMRQTSVKQALMARYDVQEELGRGGMGVVYKAMQRNLNRPVALKVLPQQIVPDEDFLKRFHSEARKAAQISHPHIITIYDEGVENGVHYIAMEYIDGEDLRNVILKHGPLPVAKVVRWLKPVVEALGYAHQKGLIHRDIKSANILISKTERPVLTDFGIARLAESSQLTRAANDTAQLTQPGTILGTLQFMSPEQIAGTPASPLSDIYAMGVVMYHCLTGELPFRGDTDWSTMQKITNAPPTSPRGIRADIPKAIESLVLKCMAKNPSHRFQNCEELAAALSEVALELDASHKGRVETKLSTKAPAPSKSRMPLFLIVGFVLLASIGGFFFWQKNNARQEQIAALMQQAEALTQADKTLLPNGEDATQALQKLLQLEAEHKAARAQLDAIRNNALARIAELRERGAQAEALAASKFLAQRFPKEQQVQNLAELLDLEQRAQEAAKRKDFIAPEFDNVLELCKSLKAIEAENPIAQKLWRDTERWLEAEYRKSMSARNETRAQELRQILRENFPENRLFADGRPQPRSEEQTTERSPVVEPRPPIATNPLSKFEQYLSRNDFEGALHELTELRRADATRNLEREAELLYERWGDYALRQGKYDVAQEKFTVAYRANPSDGLKTKLRNTVWLEIEFVTLPGGPFDMGDTFGRGEEDELRHQIHLSGFRISKHEITFAQFDAFCEATRRNKPEDNGWGRGRQPVIHVTYHDALAFCQWLSTRVQKEVRLPTEAEWEYAARAGGKKIKWAGTDQETELANMAWYDANSGKRTHLVGAKQPNALGLFDMNGNAFEWCRDVYDKNYYRRSASHDPAGPNSGERRVLRGGSIFSSVPDLRCANRHAAKPEDTSALTGFRVVY